MRNAFPDQIVLLTPAVLTVLPLTLGHRCVNGEFTYVKAKDPKSGKTYIVAQV